MELKLIYSGQLKASNGSRVKEKHEIRQQFHKQLKRLWEVKRQPLRGSVIELGGGSLTGPQALAERFQICGYRFVPLVTDEYPLCVSLDVLFLRRDKINAIRIAGGDIDNRIGTLFDALRMPRDCSELPAGAAPTEGENPFYVLLQNDSLVVDLRVSTSLLLAPLGSPPTEYENDVHLVIGVQIKPSGEWTA